MPKVGSRPTYRQSSGQQSMTFAGAGPVHMFARPRPISDHATDLTTFLRQKPTGAGSPVAGKRIPCRPGLGALPGRTATLARHGVGGDAEAVNAVFTSTSSAAPARRPRATPLRQRSSVWQSRTLFYAEGQNTKRSFSGSVVAQDLLRLMADRASWMSISARRTGQSAHGAGAQPSGKNAKSSRAAKSSKIVRRGGSSTGAPGPARGPAIELTYTAQDGKFVLVGTSTCAPAACPTRCGARWTGASFDFQ